jgi:hypothetical protein
MSGRTPRISPVQPLSVRLPDDLAELLRAEAKRQDTGVTELLREGGLLRVAFAAAARGGDVDARALLAELEKIGRQFGADR